MQNYVQSNNIGLNEKWQHRCRQISEEKIQLYLRFEQQVQIYSCHFIQLGFIIKILTVQNINLLMQISLILSSNKYNQQTQQSYYKMNKIDKLSTFQFKIILGVSFLAFLFSVFQWYTVLLLLNTFFFGLKTLERIFTNMTKKGVSYYLPQNIKKKLGEKSITQYVCDAKFIESVPLFNILLKSLLPEVHSSNRKKLQERQLLNSSQLQLFNQMSLPTDLECHQAARPSLLVNQSFECQQAQKLQSISTSQSSNNPSKHNLPKKNSLLIKKKFAQESSSIQQLESHNRRSSFKMDRERNISLIKSEEVIHHTGKNEMAAIHPLKTFEQYLKALMWMMKRLLGLKKMTNQIKRTSIIKITMITSIFWLIIVFQIKIDSKKGKVLFKSLHVISSILSIIGAAGASSMLLFKVYGQLKGTNQNKKSIK